MKLMVDARYTRIGFHDGISRYTASLLGALKELMDSGAPEVADVQLVMVISDERQLQMLPDLPHVKICSPTGPLEPTAALQLNKYKPDVVFSPMQTIGSVGRKFKLVLTLHDLIYYDHPTPPGFLPAPVRAGWRLFHKSYTPQRMLLNRADAVVTVSESTARLIREHRLTEKPLHVVPNAPQPGSVVSEDEALRRAKSRAEGASRHLVYMGSFMPYKNVETLLYAMRELPGYTLHLLSKMPDARRAELEDQGLLSPLAAGSNVV
ncbi:MAG: glycosyltransferase, partial [Rothia dentocariosa]|nr:glycosyltransferase [Rothia dentocariosa]